jgi:hypothetical protein
MKKTEDILSLMANIEEIKKKFKSSFNYNEFETNLAKTMNE